jgi:hypothetical protein
MTTKAGEPKEQGARALIAQALRLSESERVHVAAELLESLQGPADDTSDDDWLAEINRRGRACGAAKASVNRGRSCGTSC